MEYDIQNLIVLGRVFLPGFLPGFLKWVYRKKPTKFFWVRARVSEPCHKVTAIMTKTGPEEQLEAHQAQHYFLAAACVGGRAVMLH